MSETAIRYKGTVLDVNRMMASGTMYTYVLIRADGNNAVLVLNSSAARYPHMAFAMMGQRVEWGVSKENYFTEFTILFAESPRPWEQDPRVGPPKS